MRKAFFAIVIFLAATVPLYFLYIAFIFEDYSSPKEIVEKTEGAIGYFQIGQTKSQILQDSRNHVFGQNQVQKECKNWLEEWRSNQKEKSCLLSSESWRASADGLETYCPRKRNEIVYLYFKEELLRKVRIECWLAE